MSKREGVGSPSKAKKSKMADVETKVRALQAARSVAPALARIPPWQGYLGALSW